MVQFIWADTLLSDTESGTTRQPGFLFLYFLLTKRNHAKLFDRDIELPLGHLLSRWFHLKLARWGKEVVSENEREMTPSFQMAVCPAMQYATSAAWPQLDDDETLSQLANGADVHLAVISSRSVVRDPTGIRIFFTSWTSCLRSVICGPLDPMAARMRSIMGSIPREFFSQQCHEYVTTSDWPPDTLELSMQ